MPARGRARLILPAAIALAGLAVLVALGVWQVQRAAWKGEVIARIEARIGEAPGPLPAAPDPVADAYRAVEMRGRIEEPSAPVFGTWRGAGPGYRIVAPFETADGRRVLLDRGVAAAPDPAAPEGEVVVQGNLVWPDERGGPSADGIWTARDVTRLAEALGTEPLLVVLRDSDAPAPAVRAVPVDAAGIPDNHLGYAVQWFGLAAVWAAMSALWLWRLWRREEG